MLRNVFSRLRVCETGTWRVTNRIIIIIIICIKWLENVHKRVVVVDVDIAKAKSDASQMFEWTWISGLNYNSDSKTFGVD